MDSVNDSFGVVDPITQTGVTQIVNKIDALLPQTQCERCGYDGCRPYATAIAAGDAAINQCAPGGQETIVALAVLLGTEALAPSPEHWPEYPVDADHAAVALIDESLCIGCFKCVLVCPVDAIVGAPKFMHTVLAAECSGCELCLPPCPVDCITIVPRAAALPSPSVQAPHWREQHEARQKRLAADRAQRDEARRRRRSATLKDQAQGFDIAAAIARSQQARLQNRKPS